MSLAIQFYKYQGTGNDFVIIDNRDLFFKNNTKLIWHLCDRKFGIGADGLICLQHSEQDNVDFQMVYYNADGNESSMCGNGGRCIVAFAKYLGIIKNSCIFDAIDGLHEAKIDDNFTVELKMKDVDDISSYNSDFILDTGSPHYIQIHDSLNTINVKQEGAKIRYSEDFIKEGINVNFVQIEDNALEMRTYERGVEDETLSCGTGVTAAAIAVHAQHGITGNDIQVKTQGGNLKIRLQQDGKSYKNIWLIGPAVKVFKGEIEC